jgi:hypothetical protein
VSLTLDARRGASAGCSIIARCPWHDAAADTAIGAMAGPDRTARHRLCASGASHSCARSVLSPAMAYQAIDSS